MKPRVFVSSTFYDLKYIREELSNFIKEHSFEPIRFEEGDIGYTPGKKLDSSCYQAMHNSDMAILIIGGKYGSIASDDEQVVEEGFKEYISITQKEYNEAIKSGIPLYVFIESSVHGEYNTYKNNKENIENNPDFITFSTIDNLNIFRFIYEIYALGTVSVTPFSSPKEIKTYLGKQWADLFKNHLESIKNQQQIIDLQKSITKMDNILHSMEKMLGGIGKKVYEDDEDSYQRLQEEVGIDKLCKFILENCTIVATKLDNKKENVENMLTCLLSVYLNFKEQREAHGDDENRDGLIWGLLDDKSEKYGLHFNNCAVPDEESEFEEYYALLSNNPDKLINKLSKIPYYDNIFIGVEDDDCDETD